MPRAAFSSLKAEIEKTLSSVIGEKLAGRVYRAQRIRPLTNVRSRRRAVPEFQIHCPVPFCFE
jgi:hypothetical protein